MAYRDNAKRLCLDAMLLALSLILSYIEVLLPLGALLPLPGFKLGLCNILITFVFVVISPIDAGMISLCRTLLMGLLFGNIAGFTFSLAGACLSYAGLWLFTKWGKNRFSMVGVSVGCAALHNIGQLIAATLWFGAEAVMGYLPFLLVASVVFGSVTGLLLEMLLPRVKHLMPKNTTANQ